jgi:hypothetical protein
LLGDVSDGTPRGCQAYYRQPVSVRLVPAIIVTAIAAVTASAVPAKNFGPGDLRACNATRCVPVREVAALELLAGFYYSGPVPSPTSRPRFGAPVFELRFRNGYVTGIVATTRLDRFLSYGVHLGWFRKGTWYRVPDQAAQELRRLTASLRPLRLSRKSLARSH